MWQRWNVAKMSRFSMFHCRAVHSSAADHAGARVFLHGGFVVMDHREEHDDDLLAEVVVALIHAGRQGMHQITRALRPQKRQSDQESKRPPGIHRKSDQRIHLIG